MSKKKKENFKFLLKTFQSEEIGNQQRGVQQPVQGHEFSLRCTGPFCRSWKLFMKRDCNESRLIEVLKTLSQGRQLPQKYRLHKLHGPFKDCWECHVTDDLLLVWKLDVKKREIILVGLGTHRELFDKQKR